MRLVSRYGHAYEWTGPSICDLVFHPEEPCQKKTIEHSAVAVHVYFYEVALVQDSSIWKAIAFVMPNAELNRPYLLESYITSIAWIEREAGIEFMPNSKCGIAPRVDFGAVGDVP